MARRCRSNGSRASTASIIKPREAIKADKPIKAFTVIGKIIDDEPFQAVQSELFKPFRQQVDYPKAKDAEIHPLTRYAFIFARRPGVGAGAEA